MIKSCWWTISLLLTMANAGFGQAEKPLLLQQPAVNRTQIVFVYAGDLWMVSRAGGEAKQLTSGVGRETEGRWTASPRSRFRRTARGRSISEARTGR